MLDGASWAAWRWRSSMAGSTRGGDGRCSRGVARRRAFGPSRWPASRSGPTSRSWAASAAGGRRTSVAWPRLTLTCCRCFSPGTSLLGTGWRCSVGSWKGQHWTEADPSLPGPRAGRSDGRALGAMAPSQVARARRGVVDHASPGRLVSPQGPTFCRPGRWEGFGMMCPRCQHENRAAAKFCEECGTPLRRPERSAHPALPYEDLQLSLTEAQEQQTATSEVLKVISRSAFDLQPVFETLVENAVRLCGAEHGAIRRFDGERLHAAAQYNASPQFEAYFKENPIAPGRGSAAGRAALERQTIHIEDALNEPEYTFGVQHLVDPIRSVVAIPMVRAGALLGVITIHRYEVRPFTDKQIALLQTFADQAVIAIENVRLFKELEARTHELTQSVEQLTALGEVSRAVTSTLDVETVLSIVGLRARQLASADGCVIYEYDA